MAQRSPYASRTFAIVIMALATFALSSPSASFAKDFEVWLVDQSNSNGKTFGGTIHIYGSSAFRVGKKSCLSART